MMFELTAGFEIDGVWWTGRNSRHAVAGRLIRSPTDGLRLNLSGRLRQSREGPLSAITGWSENGKALTLLNPIRTSRHGSVPGYSRDDYVANFLLIGRHFYSQRAVRASSIELECSHIDRWIDHDAFELSPSSEPTLRYRKWPGLEINIPDTGLTAKLAIRDRYERKRARAFHWMLVPSFTIERVKPWDLESLLEQVRRARALLTLLIGAPVVVRRVTAHGEEESVDEKLLPGMKTRKSFEIVFTPPWPATEEELHPLEFFVLFADLSPHFAAVMSNWFVKARDLGPVVSLLMGALGESLPLEFLFLCLMQALESLHRRRGSGRYLDPKAYHRVRARLSEAIPSHLPDDLKQSLKKRLEFGNDYSLRRRMKELRGRLPAKLAGMLTTEYIEQIVQTRNHYTHYPKRRQAAVLSDKDAVAATYRLTGILYVLMLQEIGLPEALIEKLVTTNKRFLHLLETQVY